MQPGQDQEQTDLIRPCLEQKDRPGDLQRSLTNCGDFCDFLWPTEQCFCSAENSEPKLGPSGAIITAKSTSII